MKCLGNLRSGFGSMPAQVMATLALCATACQTAPDSNPSVTLTEATLTIVGEATVGVALNACSDLNMRYKNGSGAPVSSANIECRISSGDAKGSTLNPASAATDGQGEVKLRICAADQETEFELNCTSPNDSNVTYRVLVGVPNLSGTYQIKSYFGVGNSLPGALTDLTQFFQEVSTAGSLSSWVQSRLGIGGILLNLADQLFNDGNFSQWVNSLPPPFFQAMAQIGGSLNDVIGNQTFISEMAVRADSGGDYRATHRVTSASCKRDGQPVQLGNATNNGASAVTVKFVRESGKVEIGEHDMRDVPYGEFIKRCVDESTKATSGSTSFAGYLEAMCNQQTATSVQNCRVLKDLLVGYINNKVDDVARQTLSFSKGEAVPQPGGTTELTLEGLKEGKWSLKPSGSADFEGTRIGDAAALQ